MNERPITIGATGGSGTRVLVEILEKAGVYMGGPKRNGAGDAMPFEAPIRNRARKYLTGKLPPESMKNEFLVAVRTHRHAMKNPEGCWGWKNPRGMFFFDFYARHLFPEVRIVHLVRDGRDMAFSRNKGQLKPFGFLLPPKTEAWVDTSRKALLWMVGNTVVADRGEALGDQYLRLRFEDLCATPEGTIPRLLVHVGIEVEDDALTRLAALVKPPPTIGRWREYSNGEQIEDLIRPALVRFGYLEDT